MSSTTKIGFIQSFRLLIRCFSYMKEMRARYIIGLSFSSLELVMLLFTPYINEKLVQTVTLQYNDYTVRVVIYLFIGFLALIPFVAIGRYWQNISSVKGCNEIRKAVLAHIQKLSASATTDKKTGDYITRLTTDADRAGYTFQSFAIVSLARFIVQTSVALVLLIISDWRIALVSIVYSLINFYLSTKLNPYAKQLDQQARVQTATSSSYIIDIMRSIPVIKMFLLRDVLAEKYTRICEGIFLKRSRFRTVNGIAYGVIDFFTFSAQAIGFIVGMLLILSNQMTIATCVYTASLMALMADGMLRFSTFLLLIQPSIVSAQRVFELLDTPTEQVRATTVKPNLNSKLAIEFCDITFGYGDTTIIDSFNIQVKQGEHIAIVGGSGGGKSTLIKLLLEFYNPSSGKILFFGTDSRSISIQDIRNLAAYVPQDCTVFDGTIFENIQLGRPNSSMEEVVTAAKRANIHDFIVSLKDDYNSLVGERGSQLSGGQRQRIAIARAILKDAPILLLDEATAALDSESENEVQQGLYELTKGKTTITIAHRLATIKGADRILVMEQGQIVEQGNHDNLLAQGGRYKELYDNQFK